MTTEKILLNEERNVTLTAYIQECDGEFGFSKRPAMIVIPGGGYAMCSDREADPVATAYMKAGYQAFILRYTVKSKGGWPNPIKDYEAAMDMIVSNADKWNVDTSKIAVVGFSAGGHLAACAATISEKKPAAAILVYPAILKEIVDLCQPDMPYPNEHVTAKTSPCFIVAARDDRTVDIRNALEMELALAKNSVPFESHIYSYGGHGFSTGEEWIITNSVSERVADWIPDSISWLSEVMGKFTRNGFTQPNTSICLNGDAAPVLSVECTLNHIRKQNQDVREIMQKMYHGIEVAAKIRNCSIEGLMAAVGNNTVREIMEICQIPADEIVEIDKKLHGIVNTPEV